ncbi:MAG: hypothetical protein LBO67_04545 [Spirochaetaceae bacterium]|nr:hypothetical protein [Spirochaetaceae bacterium]
MKKNRLFMLGVIGILAAALLLTGCDESKPKGDGDKQKSLVITGLGNEFNGDSFNVGVMNNSDRTEGVAWGTGTASSNRLEVSLFEVINNEQLTSTPWTKTGSYYVFFSDSGPKVFTTRNKVSFTSETTTINFSNFAESSP